MSTKLPKRTELEAALADLTGGLKRPDDTWKTCLEWSELIGLKKSWTNGKLDKLVKTGEWERKDFSATTKNGRRQSIPHYRKKP